MKSRSIFTLAFCFWLCFTTQSPLFGQTLATVGTDFWLGYMHNTGSSSEELRLFITSQTATTGTVSIPLQGWSVNFTVAPNVTTTVVVPLGMGETITHDQVDTRGIHVTTADSASLFAINFAVFSADASKILPSSSLGTEYVVSAYPGILSFSRSEFLIVATADNTEIEITPSVTTQGGHAAGVTYTINLNEGETYQVRASSTVDDLTGTKLVGTAQSGDCRPFAVFGGAQCTNVPSGCTTCDHLYDQLFPVYAWGTEYYVSPFQSTGVYTYRILAKENGTQVSIDGGAPQTLNAGQVLEFNNVAVPRQVVSTLPVQVIQLMQGDNCSLNGDPAMLALNANDQRISNVTFSTVSSAVITNHFLNLIVESANIGSVLLDNVPIPASNFSAFPTNPANAYAQIPVSQGSHSVYAANGFTGYAYGMGTAESYAYSLGSYKGQVEIPVDSVICTSTPVTLTTPLNLFSPVWTALSDTSVVLGTSSNLNLTAPIATDVYVANGVSPLSGCPVSYSYSVSQTFSPQLLIEASEDTVCMFNPITMHVDVLDPGYFEYTWWPSYSFSNSANDTTVLIPSASGWYGVTVMNNGGGCAEASDSIYITVDGSSIESATVSASQNIVCWPDTIQLEALVNEILLYDEFSTGVGSTFWNTVSGANVATTCGAVSGDALFFNGAPARVLESVDFDVSLGGNLSFYLLVADGSAPCDDAEFGENIVLEYSTNGGSTWTPWTTLFEFNYPTATLVSIALPPTAQTGATRFRWSQPVFTGVNQDVWWLDNVLLSGSGSGSGLLYNWSPSAFVGNSGAASTQAFPDVPTWYTLVVGTGSCSYTDSVFVDVTLPISLTLNQDTIVCGSQAIQLEAMTSGTGNLTYTWGPPNVYSSINGASATVLPNLDTLCYVTVESGNGCFTQSDTVSVAFVDLSLSLQGNTTVCLGEQTTLSATVLGSANPTMAWYDGNANLVSSQANVTVSPTVNTTYYFETFDAQSGCSLHDSLEVGVHQFTVNAGLDTSLCQVSGYVLQGATSAANPQISWTHPGTLSNANSLTPTLLSNLGNTYVLTVNDGTCSFSDTVVVLSNPPVLEYIPQDTLICESTSFVLDLGNASNVVWSPMTGVSSAGNLWTIQPVANTDYAVVYLTENNCPVSDSMSVELLGFPQVTLPQDQVACLGSTVSVSATASPSGGTYVWNTGASGNQIQTSTSGTYWVSYSNICGADSDTMIINNYTPFTLDLGADTTLCNGTAVSLAPALPVGASILWSTGATTPSIGVVAPVSVSAVADDGNGCLQEDTLTIFIFPAIQSNLPATGGFCSGDSLLLDASAPQGIAYDWNTGQQTSFIYVQMPGTFSVEIADNFGCSMLINTQVTEWSVPAPSILGPAIYCSNEIPTYQVLGNYASYTWNTGGTTASTTVQNGANPLILEVSDFNGCMGSDTLVLTEIAVPDMDLGDDIVLCDSSTTVLNATVPGASSYTWQPNDETTSSIDAVPGVYSVEITYDQCFIHDTIRIDVKPFEFDLGDAQLVCRDAPITFVQSMKNIDSLLWNDGSQGGFHVVSTESVWEDSIVISATAFGCEVRTDSVIVHFESCDCQVYLPNAFTADNDGINETFRAYFDCEMEAFEFWIFNRWGQVIFHSEDPNFEWDGTLADGAPVQDGVYTWQLRFVAAYSNVSDYEELHGHVNVLH